MGLDMRPPLFVHLLGRGGTVSLHVPFQATSEALSDTPLFLLLASALVLLPFSFDSILCCSFESSGGRNRSKSFESLATLKSLPPRAENSASTLRFEMLAAKSARLALTTAS